MMGLRFKSISTRLSALYATMFAAAMVCISTALYLTIDHAAGAQVERQLVSSGAVYDRIWQQRAAQLRDAASLLAKDFGFLEALATGDQETEFSALENLRNRLGAQTAFIVSVDGEVTGLSDRRMEEQAAALWYALDAGQLSGVATIGDRARQVVAAPIMAPSLYG